MTEGMNQTPIDDAECLRFEERLMAYLERELNDADRQLMDQHRAGCARCETLVSDIERLVTQASALPAFAPSRDLWSGIADRLDAPVVPLYAKTPVDAPVLQRAPATSGARSTRRGMSVQWMAIAATVLVTVTSAVTWRIARTPVEAPPAVATTEPVIDSASDVITVTPVVNASDVYEH